MSKDRNLVLVVDDDPGVLGAIKRLLRQRDYEPILFSSAQAFKSHTDFENAACVILDINLQRRIRDRTETGSQGSGRFGARHLHHREGNPCRSRRCAGNRVRRPSHKAILSAGADGTA